VVMVCALETWQAILLISGTLENIQEEAKRIVCAEAKIR